MVSKTGKGSNGSVEWGTYEYTQGQLYNFIDNVLDGQREGGMPTRYHAKWYIANDYLGIYMRVAPGLILGNMNNMFDEYSTTCVVHIIRSVFGGVQEVYISRY